MRITIDKDIIRLYEKTGYTHEVLVKVIDDCECNDRRFIFKDEDIVYNKSRSSIVGETVVCNKCKKEVAMIIENPKKIYIEIEDEMRIVEDIEECSCENKKIILDKNDNILCSQCNKIIAKAKEIPFSIVGRTRATLGENGLLDERRPINKKWIAIEYKDKCKEYIYSTILVNDNNNLCIEMSYREEDFNFKKTELMIENPYDRELYYP